MPIPDRSQKSGMPIVVILDTTSTKQTTATKQPTVPAVLTEDSARAPRTKRGKRAKLCQRRSGSMTPSPSPPTHQDQNTMAYNQFDVLAAVCSSRLKHIEQSWQGTPAASFSGVADGLQVLPGNTSSESIVVSSPGEDDVMQVLSPKIVMTLVSALENRWRPNRSIYV